MIVRIMGAGQLSVDDSHLEELNAHDSSLEQAVAGGDEPAFRAALTALLDAVRRVGTPVPDDELVDSELILPPDDATLDDVRQLLDDDGLIPG